MIAVRKVPFEEGARWRHRGLKAAGPKPSLRAWPKNEQAPERRLRSRHDEGMSGASVRDRSVRPGRARDIRGGCRGWRLARGRLGIEVTGLEQGLQLLAAQEDHVRGQPA